MFKIYFKDIIIIKAHTVHMLKTRVNRVPNTFNRVQSATRSSTRQFARIHYSEV